MDKRISLLGNSILYKATFQRIMNGQFLYKEIINILENRNSNY